VTLWAIVPVKPLQRSKSRLGKILTREQRVALSQGLLIHTLEILTQTPGIDRILVVSRDSKALTLARQHGARTVLEQESPSLNRALSRATILARGYNVSSVLILPADLPLLTVQDLSTFLEAGRTPPVVVIAPDRRGGGTNALLCSPPGIIEYAFGQHSFARHVERAREAEAKIELCSLPTLAFDLDVPEDLELLRMQQGESAMVV
jgi:2-phospho-L-lactate guanylyltransferase